MTSLDTLRALLRRNLGGEAVGVISVCSAHPLVVETALQHAARRGATALIEATCNQVNHRGGYTGLTPAEFRTQVVAAGDRVGVPREAILLGGDHLGPNPWRDRPAAEAMAEAGQMIAAYAAAGFGKIHLDASMACADDPPHLSAELIAQRAASLCAICEGAVPPELPRPVYVIGTEVPSPGGAADTAEHLSVTQVDDLHRTLALHRAAFAAQGLQDAFARVIAVVVQPGVEFGNASVDVFRPALATALSAAATGLARAVFEAHSTDYQPLDALCGLVAGHFAILKVGPELTFAMREAIFALAAMEAELLPPERRSMLRETIEAAMLAQPGWWQSHYRGDADALRVARGFSLSDRIRYYWSAPGVAAAFDRLMHNLAEVTIPPALVAQYFPKFMPDLAVPVAIDPAELIRRRIETVLDRYARACGSVILGRSQASSPRAPSERPPGPARRPVS